VAVTLTTLATDFHTHVFPDGMIPMAIHRANAVNRAVKLGRDQEYIETLVPRIVENIEDPVGELLRRDLEGAGISRAVVVGLDWGLVVGATTEMTLEQQLAWGLDLVDRHGGFYSFILGVDPRRQEAAEIVRRALRDERVIGVKLYPPAGFAPTDPMCDPIYEAVVDAGALLMVHTGRQTFPFDLAYGRLEPYSDVQRRYPSLRLVLGHSGHDLWGAEAIAVAGGHTRTYLEVSGWGNDVARDADTVRRFLHRAWEQVGPGRVLFGSDFFSGPRHLGSGVVDRWKQFVEACAAEAGVAFDATESSVEALLTRA
jgi:predicted TIM-barrel fold metal-dependent hydrolase